MSKREYRGQEVAVKKLRIYSTSDMEKIVRVGHQSYSWFSTSSFER